MWWFILTVLSLGLLVSVWAECIRQRELRPLLSRRCSGWRWHRLFPDASTADIRSFLTLFADCFGIRRKHRLAFRPDDRIMDIYRALYPPQCSIADAMDMDDLAAEMEETYGLHLDEVWHENISLGELFDNARSAQGDRL